jgi:hypothetical protein
MTNKLGLKLGLATGGKDDTAIPLNPSRRAFGRLVGTNALVAATVSISACGGNSGSGDADPAPVPATPNADLQPLTRAAFVAAISTYFDWVHSSEYIDYAKNVQKTYVDVILGVTPLAKQIETALEESVIDSSQGYFYPDQPVTRADAAVMLVRAFKLPLAGSDALGKFSDAATISVQARPSVNTLVAAGYMTGASDTLFSPAASVSGSDAKAIMARITAATVAPPQVMPKSGTTASRRYVNITTPTPGATVYYTYTMDGTTPEDPSTSAKALTFNLRENGTLQFVNAQGSTVDSKLVRLRTVARKAGLADSAVREFTWDIVRPVTGKFQAKLVHAASSTTPAVWMINNPSEYFQAHVFYIEGSTSGLVFDAGEYARNADPSSDLKSYIDTLASKPYVLALGHSHSDHAEQIDSFAAAGIPFYVSVVERAALSRSTRADFVHAASVAIPLEDGHVFDLGNCQVTAWLVPGHTNGLTTIVVNQTGWVYASDMWACNRPYTADTTQYNGVKVDLMLSMARQVLSNYKRSSTSGLVTEVTNAHQEVAVGMPAVLNFLQCFQQLIDGGDAASEPSIRGGIKGNPTSPNTRNSRMSKVGDMWRDKNWIAIGNSLGTSLDVVDYFTAPTAAYPCGAIIDYNAADAYKKYSVLSHVDISGGTLVGVDIYWAAPTNGTPNMLPNKFDPWTYAYTINVPLATKNIVLTPVSLSTKIQSMTLNGVAVKSGSDNTIAVAAGSQIVIIVLSPDGTTTSTYRFSIASI